MSVCSVNTLRQWLFQIWLVAAGLGLGLRTSAAPPTIAAIANQTVVIDRPTDAIHLTVSDGAETPELNLQLRGLSSDTNLVPTNNIFFGVAFNTWYLTVTPMFGRTGSNTISVIVRDGAGEEATNSFLFIVNPVPVAYTRFAQTNAILIPGVTNTASPASPYPSTNTVSGMVGGITNMTMTFSALSHERVQDVNMLLVSPAGIGSVLFSEVSGQNRKCTNTTITFDDSALYLLPQDFALWSEPLRAADFDTATNNFPGVTWTNAPVSLSSFKGTSPNGNWLLYIHDDKATNNGAIVGGWSLLIATSVGASNAPPTIAAIPNRNTIMGRAAGPFDITFGDAETPAGSLLVTAGSSNTNLVRDSDIIIFNGGVHTLTVQPVDGVTGTATITVNVSDGLHVTSTNFLLTVTPPGVDAGIFDNTNTISIPLTNIATAYPSTNVVAGFVGTITNLTLTLKGLTHSAPHDLEMMLVGPGGQKSVFFSHVGAGTASNLTVTVDDSASYKLPASPFTVLTGTYKSADFGHDIFPSQAPVGPYGTNMSPFLGTLANGNWLLYIMNDPAGTGSGTIAKGWSLFIATDATNSPPVATNVLVSIQEDTFTNLTLFGIDAGGSVTFAPLQSPTNGMLSNFNTNTGTVTYRPATNYFGPDYFTYRVSDGGQFATGTVSITVSPVNDAPTAGSFGVTLPEDSTTNITLLGGDVESTVAYSLVSNPSHGTLSGLDTSNGLITYQPQTNYFGADAFSYRVTDGGLFATGTVSITVSSVDDPAVSDDQLIIMPKNTMTNLVLTATDIDSSNTVSDVVAATGTVTPDNWTPSPPTNKTAAVASNDGDTSFLLSGSAADTQQQFTLADPLHIQPGDAINSVTLRATCRRNSTPSGSVQLTAVLGGNTTAGAAHATGNNYADFTDVFSTRPGGGAWTLTDVQNLAIRIQNTQDRDIACTRFDAIVSFAGSTNRTYAILTAPTHGSLGTLNTNNGSVTYTPNVGYTGSDSFTFQVNSGGTLSTGLVSIVLTGTNSSPVVANPIGTQFGGYATNFNFTFPTNTFTDVDTSALSYSASGMPPGVLFNGGTRTFAGIPTASGNYPVGLVATDDGAPPLSATNTFTISISKRALIVTANNTNKVYGQTMNFAGTEFAAGGLTNGDSVVSVSLTSAGSPAGAALGSYPIVAANAIGIGLTNYLISYGDGTLVVTNVGALFEITSVVVSNGTATIVWNSFSNQIYQLQYNDNLSTTNWTGVPPAVTATGPTVTVTNNISGAPTRFYRVWLPE